MIVETDFGDVLKPDTVVMGSGFIFPSSIEADFLNLGPTQAYFFHAARDGLLHAYKVAPDGSLSEFLPFGAARLKRRKPATPEGSGREVVLN